MLYNSLNRYLKNKLLNHFLNVEGVVQTSTHEYNDVVRLFQTIILN
jgi:hypothetical protein